MKKYWIPGPITNYGTTDAGFRGEVRVVLASDHEARLAEVEQDRDKWRERAFNSLRSQEVLRVTDSASVVQYKPCEICTTQSWCETHGCQCYPVSAVQPERCCLDYPRCDCNSPPEPGDETSAQLAEAQRSLHSADPVIHAQHGETGRMWTGPRSQLPRRYFECSAPGIVP